MKLKFMKIGILLTWIICISVFAVSLDAQSQLNSDTRSEAPIEASVDKPDELTQKDSYRQVNGSTLIEFPKEVSEKIYRVEEFVFSYGNENSNLPEIEELQNLKVYLKLKVSEWLYMEWGEDFRPLSGASTGAAEGRIIPQHVKIGEIPKGASFSEGALRQILTELVAYFNDNDYYGVYLSIDDTQIDPVTGKDNRWIFDRSLKVVIWCSEVAEVRTIAKGNRIPPEESINNEHHSKILDNSPLVGQKEDQSGSPLNKSKVENYLQRLSRHPGRQVDSAISSSGEPNEVVLDYLVNESKPYILYAQVSNTGVESTGDWRQRLGLIHYQITDNDDILSLDFITSEFDRTNSFLTSYEVPVIYPNYLKFGAFGSWSEYDGDEVGISQVGFSGETTAAGFEFTASPFASDGFNFDTLAGFRWADIEVTNRTLGEEGSTHIWVPYLGVTVNQRNQLGSLDGSLTLEGNTGGGIAANERDGALGRNNVDSNWQILRGHFHSNLFLEPLIFGADWKERSTWQSSTLAHELNFKFNFQYVLGDDRVIPQEQFIVGGFATVRGYDESVAAGDSGVNMNLEYRYHLPRSLKPYAVLGKSSKPKRESSGFFNNFNLRPPYVYGSPDWDLILISFVDYGYTHVNEKLSGEENLTLTSAGLGAELQVLSNLSIRLDWGLVLNTLKSNGVEIEDAASGDSRFHFITTLSW